MEKSRMMLKLEALKKELAAKSKKLEKSKHGAKVRAYVREKVKRHNELDNLGVGVCEKALTDVHESGKQSCDTLDRKQEQIASVLETDDLCRKDDIHPLHNGSTRKGANKDALHLSEKATQSSSMRVECVSNIKDEKGICGSLKGASKISRKCEQSPMSNRMARTVISPNLMLESGLLKNDEKNADCDSKGAIDIDNKHDAIGTNSCVTKRKSFWKNKPKVDNVRNPVDSKSSVCSSKRNDETYVLGSDNDLNSFSKPSIDLVSKSTSSATIVDIVTKERIGVASRQLSQKEYEINVHTASQTLTHSNVSNARNLCKKSYPNISDSKITSNANGVPGEDSTCFITPSFQSGKQSCEQNVDVNRIPTKYPTLRDDLMSNVDFLNVLGVSQNDYDVSRPCISNQNSSCDHGRMGTGKVAGDGSNEPLSKCGVSVTKCDGIEKRKDDCCVSKLDGTSKLLTLKSRTCSPVNDGVNVKLHCQISTTDSSPNHLETDSVSSVTTDSTVASEYTELDVIPYSQFELTEDFLSENSCSQSDSISNPRKRKSRLVGPLIKRKSPRLSSNLFLSFDSHSSEDSLLQYKRNKQSLPTQRKAVAVMSVFQLLMDSAKNKSSQEDYQLPNEFWVLMEAKSKGASVEDTIQHVNLEKIDNVDLRERDTFHQSVDVIEDSETVEMIGVMREKNSEKQNGTNHIDNCPFVKEIDVIEESEVVLSDDQRKDNEIKDGEPEFESGSPFLLQKPKENYSEGNNESESPGKLQSKEYTESCEVQNYNVRLDIHERNTEDNSDQNADGLPHNRNEMVLPTIGGDADHELTHSLRDVDDSSVIQSSYYSTPVKFADTGKHNKDTLPQCRKSLKIPLFGRRDSLARLALSNHSNIAKTKDNFALVDEAGDLVKSSDLDESNTFSSAMPLISGRLIGQRALSLSPVGVGACENHNSSPSFMSSLMSSSTPKSDRQRSKISSSQDALSPIANKLFCPLANRNTEAMPTSLPMSPERGDINVNTSGCNLDSLTSTSTPKSKQIRQSCLFSPIEKTVPSQNIHTSGFLDGDISIQIGDCDQTLKAGCSNDESHKYVITSCDDEHSIFKNQSDASISMSDANSTSKTETRLTVGDDYDDIKAPLSAKLTEIDISNLANVANIYAGDKSKPFTPKPNKYLEMSGGKSPFSKYLEESIVLQEADDDDKIHQSPTHVSPWQRIPKTSSTPLQIFETSCTATPRLLSPIFTPSRMSRSRGKISAGSMKNRSKKTLKFDGCFQSCSEDAVVQLLHGKLFVKEAADNAGEDAAGGGRWKRYLVSVQASALTVWIQNDNQNNWSPELDWRLSANIHILHASIIPIADKIAIAASGWEKTHPIVTVFVYDFARDHTLRFNIPHVGHQSNLRVSQIHLCPFPSSSLIVTTSSPPLQPQILLGMSSNSHHTLHRVVFHPDIQGVSTSQAFDTLHRGKLNTLLLCRGQEKACVCLTWDQRITVWNTEHRVALRTITIPSTLPCLTALVDVQAVGGLLLMTASWRVEDMGDCGGILVWNPMAGRLTKSRVWNIPNSGWRSTEKTNKEKNHIYSTSSSGSVSWWDRRNGNMVGYRQSNIATCVSGIEDKHLVVGEMHGCVHLYSMY